MISATRLPMKSAMPSVSTTRTALGRSWATVMRNGFASYNLGMWRVRWCSMEQPAGTVWKWPPNPKTPSKPAWHADLNGPPAAGPFRHGRNEGLVRLAPQLRCGDIGAPAQRFEFFPDNGCGHPFAPGKGAKPAIGGGNHALPVAHHIHGLQQPAGNHLRMLHKIRGAIDHARDEQPLFGQRRSA